MSPLANVITSLILCAIGALFVVLVVAGLAS